MGIKKKLLYFIMATVFVCGAELSADNTAIIQAIKANPALLDSPQAKAMMQDAKSTPASISSKVETPINTIVKEVKSEEKNEDNTSKKVPQTTLNDEINSFYRSPLSIEKSADYSKRLIARQTKESPKELKRYGIEFFNNKNGMDLASLPVPENYKLVPKDVLNVVLYGPKSDNMSLTVDKDGTVVIPSFGPLQIAGLSFNEAKKTITDALMAAYPNVGVTVNISQFSSIQVTLAGEVAIPGIYNVSSFSTIKEALISAGGLSPNGSMRSVSIKRQGRIFATIDLYTIIRGTGRSDPLLRAGDIIIVPIMGKSVIIDGDVKRPAIYEAKQNTSIAMLIEYAGGLQASASKNDIRITRYEGHQGMKVFNVSLAESAKMVAQDQDKIYVHDLDKSNLRGITLYGNVIKPGFWPLSSDGTSVKEFFEREISQNTLRGVFLEGTYFDYAIVKRTNSNLKEELIGFSLSDALSGKEKVLLKNRDELYVLNSLAVAPTPVVKLSGECILKEGEYKFFDKMTLDALLSTAGSKCLIDKQKVTIVSRDKKTLRPSVRVVNAANNAPVYLNEFDEVSVVGYYTTNPVNQASIAGEVYKAGTYPIADSGFTVRNLILSAGGMTDKASMDKIEIVRYEIVAGVRERQVLSITRDVAMSEASIALLPYDEVTVFKIPQWNERKSIKLVGKVKYPGEYAIEDGDTLSSVIKRAGGLTALSYPQGAVFTREDLKKRQREGMERQMKDLENRIIYQATQPVEAGQTSSDKMQLVSLIGTLKEDINASKPVGRLAIRLDADMKKFEGSSSDVVLKDGDALYVPEREDSVMIQGQVLNPNAVVYSSTMSVDDYLEKAGGLKESADEDNIFIVHADGEAQAYKNGFFDPNIVVGPGDIIVVPMHISTYSGMQFAKDITAILYQLAVSAAALTTIGAL